MKRSKVKFIKPPNTLKMKAGHGGVPEELIARAEKFIATYEADFRPDARRFLKQMEEGRARAKAALGREKRPANKIDEIVKPVMQLKAHGGMFQYRLVSDVADICLQFLEAVHEYDAEALDIIEAHEKTIAIILNNQLKGDGGKEGYSLVMELHKACKRYFKKHLDG